jgi:predicted dienelactone hydrolase
MGTTICSPWNPNSSDIAETLADAGFVAVAINHPGDTTSDMSRSGDLSVFIERPTDIKRLIDFMIDASPRDKGGGPACAALRLLGSWKVAE